MSAAERRPSELPIAGERMHPITGLPFNYERVCRTCAHFTDKQRTVRGTKYRTTNCALDPDKRNLADTDRNTVWSSTPACSQHKKS